MVLQRTFNRFWQNCALKQTNATGKAFSPSAGSTNRNLLTKHGFLTKANIEVDVGTRAATIASALGRTEANAQLVIRFQMMHSCFKASLTPAYLKTIINILPSFAQDWPKLIYYIILNMHVESILSMHDLLQDLGSCLQAPPT